MTDREIAGLLGNVSMHATAYDFLGGLIDRSEVVARLRRGSYTTTDARYELADEIAASRTHREAPQ